MAALTDAMRRGLAEAARTATDPAAQPQQLLDAAKQLLRGGVLTGADHALGRLERAGMFAPEVRQLRFGLERLRDGATHDRRRLIDRMADVVRDPAAPDEQLLRAADTLVRIGAIEEADRALHRLERAGAYRGRVAQLRAAGRQLKRSGILSSFTVVGQPVSKELTRPHEALLSRHESGSDRLIIVFTGGARQFWMALRVLHQFLRKLGSHVIYMSDHRSRMYLDGLTGHARGYPDMLAMLSQAVSDLGAVRTNVMATSAGGYVGLRTAADLAADSFLGLSIRTDLSGAHELGPFERRAIDRCEHPDLVMNLREYLSGLAHPKSIQLYSGDSNHADAAHVENLRGLPNVTIRYVPQCQQHDIVPALLSRGLFEDVLTQFAR